jgi:hypothetical protein
VITLDKTQGGDRPSNGQMDFYNDFGTADFVIPFSTLFEAGISSSNHKKLHADLLDGS